MPWLLLVMLLFSTSAQAAWLQYRVSDGQILGAFDTQADMRPLAGSAAIEWQPGTPAEGLSWPSPSTCGHGQLEWSALSAGNTLPPVVNPSLIFLRCRAVKNLQELLAATRAEIKVARAAYLQYGDADIQASLHEVLRKCLSASGGNVILDVSADCVAARTAVNTISQLFGTTAQLKDWLQTSAAVVNEALAIKTAQGW